MTNQDKAGSAVHKALNVHNGTYTVKSPDGHFTLKLHTAVKGNLVGRRILSLLVGQDNESDYRGVAFWDDEAKRALVWTRFQKGRDSFPIDGMHWEEHRWNSVEQKLSIWCDLATRGDGTGESVKDYPYDGENRPRCGYWGSMGYSLLLEGRCVICNKKLTHPDSIASGIGPTCAGKV